MKLTTRETAAVFVRYVHAGALALYAWNAQVSAALMAPLHICEVVVRNAAADAIAAVYGVNWPWRQVFITSLPAPTKGYMARNLHEVRLPADQAEYLAFSEAGGPR